jgi:hypothetical protein
MISFKNNQKYPVIGADDSPLKARNERSPEVSQKTQPAKESLKIAHSILVQIPRDVSDGRFVIAEECPLSLDYKKAPIRSLRQPWQSRREGH